MVYDKTITNDENDGARPIKCTFGDAMPLSDKNGAQGRGQRKSGCQIDRKYMSFEEENVKLW